MPDDERTILPVRVLDDAGHLGDRRRVGRRSRNVRVDGADVIWAETRPAEGGRTQLVRRRTDGARTDLLPDGQSARTAVHEYGAGAWWARDGMVWFAAWDDQRLYRLHIETGSADRSRRVPRRPAGTDTATAM